jgi:hypothetical protein
MANKIIAIWKERKKIFEGMKNALIYDEYVEDIAGQRLAVCNDCEHKGNKCAVPKTGPCCNLCGCSLTFKTRSLSSACPETKWIALLSEEQEDALEERFNKEEE